PPSWSEIKPSVGQSLISAIAVAKGQSNQVWVGYTDGKVFRTANGLAATPSWTAANSGLPNRYCSRLTVDPTNTSEGYAPFSGSEANTLWKSTDAGTPGRGGGGVVFPAVPYYDLAMHPDNSKVLILGTEVGLFVSDDEGQTWSPTNQGPTNAPVYRFFWMNK